MNADELEEAKESLMEILSPLENYVLESYLSCKQYKTMAEQVSKKTGRQYSERGITAILLRIQRKARKLYESGEFGVII